MKYKTKFSNANHSIYHHHRAPLNENSLIPIGRDHWLRPSILRRTLAPATYDIQLWFNYLQRPSLRNKEHGFNPGNLEAIFFYLWYFASKPVSIQTHLPKFRVRSKTYQKQRLSLASMHFGSTPQRFKLFLFQTTTQYYHHSFFNRE